MKKLIVLVTCITLNLFAQKQIDSTPSPIKGTVAMTGDEWLSRTEQEKYIYIFGLFTGVDILRSMMAGLFDAPDVSQETKYILIAFSNCSSLDINVARSVELINIYTRVVSNRKLPVWLILYRSQNRDWFANTFDWDTERKYK